SSSLDDPGVSVLVPDGPEQEEEVVERAEHTHHPVEPLQVVVVQVLPLQPRPPPAAPRRAVHHRHQHRAQVVPQRQRRPRQRRRQRPHPRRRLAEEELEQPRQREQVGGPQEQVLERDPEEGDGQRRRRVEHSGVGRHVLALHLHHGGDGHGDDGEDEPRADALQVGDPHLRARGASRERDDDVVVDRGEEDDEGDREHRQRRRRHLEPPDAGVHRRRLLHGEGGQLRQAAVEHDGGEEDREHHEHDLDVLHLLHRARQRPAPRLPLHRPVQEHQLLRRLGSHLGGAVGDAADVAGLAVLLHVRAPRGAGRAVDDSAVAGALRAAAASERGGEDDLGDGGERAPRGHLVAVQPRAGDEHRDGEQDGDGGDAEPPLPPLVVLHPDGERDGDERADGEAEDEVVEEGGAPLPPPRRVLVELLGAVRREGALDAADAQRRHVQPREQHCLLRPRHWLARRAGNLGAPRRHQRRRPRLDRQDHQPQEFHKGADEVDGVGGEEGVGEEAAKEGEEEGGAHEVGHRRRRLRRRVVHEIHQVGHQVARVRQERQVLEHLHHKNEGGGEHAAVPAAHRRPVPPVDVPLPPLRLPRRRTVLLQRRH
ncbi:Os06g0581151, partial [Oryza sativa Japonica Group]